MTIQSECIAQIPDQAADARQERARRWLREPLLHFLLAGGLLFAAYTWLNAGSEAGADRVVRITPAEVNWLKESWARQWQRPPSEDEFRGLVAGYLKEVLLAREAKEIGLDEDDTIVRRRLAQKMEFLVQDTLQQADPGEAELRSFYKREQAHFQSPARVSFSHIYFNRERRGERAAADARGALRQLSVAGAEMPAEFGDRFLGQYDFAALDEQAVAATFGATFASQVIAATPGNWLGPMESGFGLHLVRVTERQSAQLQEFAAVREDVLTLWRQQRAQQGLDAYFAALRKKYDVQAEASISALLGPPAKPTEPAK